MWAAWTQRRYQYATSLIEFTRRLPTFPINPAVTFLTIEYGDRAARYFDEHPVPEELQTLPLELQCLHLLVAVWYFARRLVSLPIGEHIDMAPTQEVYETLLQPLLDTTVYDFDAVFRQAMKRPYAEELILHVPPPTDTIWTAVYTRLHTLQRVDEVDRNTGLRRRLRQLAHTLLLVIHPPEVTLARLATGIVAAALDPTPIVAATPPSLAPLTTSDNLQLHAQTMKMYVQQVASRVWRDHPELASQMPLEAGGSVSEELAELRTDQLVIVDEEYPVFDEDQVAETVWRGVTGKSPRFLQHRFAAAAKSTPLGEGGFGSVWSAVTVAEPHRAAAVKHWFHPDPDAIVPEVLTMRVLQGRESVRILDFSMTDLVAEVALEPFQGNVSTLVQENHVDGPSLMVLVATHIARALKHAHAHGISHGDVKLNNYLYRRRKDRVDIVLADYGLSRWLRHEQADRHLSNTDAFDLTQQKVAVYGYHTPEQLLESIRPDTYGNDMWRFGISLANGLDLQEHRLAPALTAYYQQMQQENPDTYLDTARHALIALRWCGFPSREAWDRVVGTPFGRLADATFPSPYPSRAPDVALWRELTPRAWQHPGLIETIRSVLQFDPAERATSEDLAHYWDRYMMTSQMEPRFYAPSEFESIWISSSLNASTRTSTLKRWNVVVEDADRLRWTRMHLNRATDVRARILMGIESFSSDAYLDQMEAEVVRDDATRIACRAVREWMPTRVNMVQAAVVDPRYEMEDAHFLNAIRAWLVQQAYAVVLSEQVWRVRTALWGSLGFTWMGSFAGRPSAFDPACVVQVRMPWVTRSEAEPLTTWIRRNEGEAMVTSKATPYAWFSADAPLVVVQHDILRAWMLQYMAQPTAVWWGVRRDVLIRMKVGGDVVGVMSGAAGVDSGLTVGEAQEWWRRVGASEVQTLAARVAARVAAASGLPGGGTPDSYAFSFYPVVSVMRALERGQNI